MKRNVLEEDIPMKKAIAKVLGYMAAASVLSFINIVLPGFFAVILTTLADVTFLAKAYVSYVGANIAAFPTPIVTIILLKPVRVAIKTMIKKVCTCCRKNRECSPTTEKHLHVAATDITGVSLATTKEDSINDGNHMATTDQNLAATETDLDAIQVSTTNENHAM